MNPNFIYQKINTTHLKDVYILEITAVHGDADNSELYTIHCNDEADFIKTITHLSLEPEHPASGGDEDIYSKWLDEFASDFPYDTHYEGLPCQIGHVDMFYYDAEGIKYSVKIKS